MMPTSLAWHLTGGQILPPTQPHKDGRSYHSHKEGKDPATKMKRDDSTALTEGEAPTHTGREEHQTHKVKEDPTTCTKGEDLAILSRRISCFFVSGRILPFMRKW